MQFCGNIKGHTDWVNDINLNMGIITASSDGTIRKWINNNSKIIGKHKAKVWRIEQIDEKTFASIGWDGYCRIWKNNKQINEYKVHHSVAMCLAVNKEYIYTGGWDKKIVRINRKTENKKIIKIQMIPMSFILVNENLIIGTKEGKIICMNKEMKIITKMNAHKSMIWRLAKLQDNIISFSYDKTVGVQQIHNQQLIRTYTLHYSDALMGGGIIENKYIAAGSLMGNLIIWKLKPKPTIIFDKRIHKKSLLTVKQHKKIIYTTSRDRSIKVFAFQNEAYKEINVMKGSEITPLATQSDENGTITGFHEKFAIYCTKNKQIKITAELSAIPAVTLNEQYAFIASANRKLVVFNRENEKIYKIIKLPDNPIKMIREKKSIIIAYRRGQIDKINNKLQLKKITKVDFKPMELKINNHELQIKNTIEEKIITVKL